MSFGAPQPKRKLAILVWGDSATVKFQGKDRRQHARYDVSDCFALKGLMSPTESAFHLLTISIGGCGFWCPEVDQAQKVPNVVSCSFIWEGLEMVKVQGEALYRYPHNFKGLQGIFVGVRFFAAEAEKIRPIIYEIENRPELKAKQAAYR